MTATIRRRIVRIAGSFHSVPTWVLARAATYKGHSKVEMLADCIVKYEAGSATIIPESVAYRSLRTLPLVGPYSSIAVGYMPDQSPFGFNPSVTYGATPIYDGLATYVISSYGEILATVPEEISSDGATYTYWGRVPSASIPDPVLQQTVVVEASVPQFGTYAAPKFCCLPGSGRLHQFNNKGEFYGEALFPVPDDCVIPGGSQTSYFFVPPYSSLPTVGWGTNPGTGATDFFVTGVTTVWFGASISSTGYNNYPSGNFVLDGPTTSPTRVLLMDHPTYVAAWEARNPTLSRGAWRAAVTTDVAALDAQFVRGRLTLSNRVLASLVAGGDMPVSWRESVWASIPRTRKVKRQTSLTVEVEDVAITNGTARVVTLSYETVISKVASLADGPTVTTLRPYGDEDPRAVRQQVLSGNKVTTYDTAGVRTTVYSTWPGESYSSGADAYQVFPVSAWTVFDGTTSLGARVDVEEAQQVGSAEITAYGAAAGRLVTEAIDAAFTAPASLSGILASSSLLSYGVTCSVPEIVDEYRHMVGFVAPAVDAYETADSKLQDGQTVSIALFGPADRGIFGSASVPSDVLFVDIFGVVSYRYSKGDFVWAGWQPCHDAEGDALPTYEEGGLTLPTPLTVATDEPLNGNAVVTVGDIRWSDVRQTAKEIAAAVRDPLGTDPDINDIRFILLALGILSVPQEGATP